MEFSTNLILVSAIKPILHLFGYILASDSTYYPYRYTMQLKQNNFKTPTQTSYTSFCFPCAASKTSKLPRDSVQRAVEIRNQAAPHLSTETTEYEEKCYSWKWSSVNYSPFKILLSSNSAEEKKALLNRARQNKHYLFNQMCPKEVVSPYAASHPAERLGSDWVVHSTKQG